tara:strand:- start:1164 stop:1427 length:264 start_codon:yes stop_codon:yes gene_type:complete
MSNIIEFPAKEEEDPEMEWFFTVEVYRKPSGKYEYQLQVDEDMDNDLDVADALARMAFQVAPEDWSQRVDVDELIIEPIDESETDEI